MKEVKSLRRLVLTLDSLVLIANLQVAQHTTGLQQTIAIITAVAFAVFAVVWATLLWRAR